MKITQDQLERFIEAEADIMKLPKDDAKDTLVPKGLDEHELDAVFLKETAHPVYAFIAKMGDELTTVLKTIDDILPSQGTLTDEFYDVFEQIDAVRAKLQEYATKGTI